MTLHFNLVLFLFIQIFCYSVLISSVLPSTFMASANFITMDLKLCQIENNKWDEFQDYVLRNLTRNQLDTTVWNIGVLLSLKINPCQFYNFSISSNLFSRFTNSIPSDTISNIPIRWLDRKMHYVVWKKVILSKKYKSHNHSQREKGQFSHCFYCSENAFSNVLKKPQNTKHQTHLWLLRYSSTTKLMILMLVELNTVLYNMWGFYEIKAILLVLYLWTTVAFWRTYLLSWNFQWVRRTHGFSLKSKGDFLTDFKIN